MMFSVEVLLLLGGRSYAYDRLGRRRASSVTRDRELQTMRQSWSLDTAYHGRWGSQTRQSGEMALAPARRPTCLPG